MYERSREIHDIMYTEWYFNVLYLYVVQCVLDNFTLLYRHIWCKLTLYTFIVYEIVSVFGFWIWISKHSIIESVLIGWRFSEGVLIGWMFLHSRYDLLKIFSECVWLVHCLLITSSFMSYVWIQKLYVLISCYCHCVGIILAGLISEELVT